MRSPALGAVSAAVVVSCLACARAQDDLRDVITVKAGPPLRGRVFCRYEPGQVTVQLGKERRLLPVADVVAMDTVRDRVREFFARLDRLPDNLKHRWFLAQWAADRELHDLARLTALDLLLREPDHEGAHTMLGHRRRLGQWEWLDDGEWRTFAELVKVRADWQHAWCIEGEHFRVKSDADLRRVVDALWDLERFHVAWFDRFGQAMRLYEVVGHKLHVAIRRDERQFLGQKTVPGEAHKNPYFAPGERLSDLPRSEPGWRVDCTVPTSNTYFAAATDPRPVRLFEVATSHLLDCTVAGDPGYVSTYRPAAWGDCGLGQYLQRSVSGPAGAAVVGAWRVDPAGVRIVLANPGHDLRHVALYDSKKLSGGISDENVFAWPAAELAVAWLLEAGQTTRLRAGFFDYMVEVRRGRKVNSSVELDRQLGQPIETLDAPWRAWLQQQIEAPVQPNTTPTRGQ